MIKLIKNISEVNGVVPSSATAVRVLSLLFSYNTNYDFARFWVQYDKDENLTALISRLDGEATVFNINGANYDEIIHFLNAVGCNSLLIENYDLPLATIESGCIMRFFGNVRSHIKIEESPKLHMVYDIMSTSFDMPNFDYWYVDISHRIRHGYSKCYVNQNASTATVSVAKKSALIYGVATLPEMRGMGLGGAVLDYALADLNKNGIDNIFVMVSNKNLQTFYENHGFMNCSLFNTYRLDFKR